MVAVFRIINCTSLVSFIVILVLNCCQKQKNSVDSRLIYKLIHCCLLNFDVGFGVHVSL